MIKKAMWGVKKAKGIAEAKEEGIKSGADSAASGFVNKALGAIVGDEET
jgi:hypothetical protein